MKLKYMSTIAVYLTIGLVSLYAQGGLEAIDFTDEAGDEAPIDDILPMLVLLVAGAVVGAKYLKRKIHRMNS
jgi:hypothetical protein